jgi:hypothetical protein
MAYSNDATSCSKADNFSHSTGILPYKQRYIAGSAKCSTKPLSKLLTHILYGLFVRELRTRLNVCKNIYSSVLFDKI